jgi:hypothetical protein
VTELDKLQDWYARQCNGDWEHQYGISVSTLDNPGWSLKVDLKGTVLEEREMADFKIDRAENDWIVARRSGDVFEAFGGTKNLGEMVQIFLDWEQGIRDRQ